MSLDQLRHAPRPAGQSGRCFTLRQANQALVYVRRIVDDLTQQYAQLATARAERDALLARRESAERLEELATEVARLVVSLTRLTEELDDVGCELKDPAAGLVDFPSRHAERPIYLCWKLGEPSVQHWHEADAGFSGRQPVTADFDG
jgi:hypothetical protein